MSPEQIRTQVMAALVEVAPEVDPTTIAGDRPLREQIDIDSYDLLQLLVSIEERLGVEVPERDYGEIETLDALVAYLGRRLAPPD